jgi:hypothetical protein
MFSTGANSVSSGYAQIVTPRFTIKKIGGHWTLRDHWLSCEIEFSTWEECVSAAANWQTASKPQPIYPPYPPVQPVPPQPGWIYPGTVWCDGWNGQAVS